MSILDLLQPKPAEHYKDLTNGGAYSVTLDQDEACVALKIHDYGVDTLTDDEKELAPRSGTGEPVNEGILTTTGEPPPHRGPSPFPAKGAEEDAFSTGILGPFANAGH